MTHEAIPQDVGSNLGGDIAVFTEPDNAIDSTERLNSELFVQLDNFLGLRRQVLINQGADSEGIKIETAFLDARLKSMIIERNMRADEHISPQVQEAINTVNRLFKAPVYGASCIDSRLSRTIVYGLPMGPGGFIRVEAGDIEDFVQGEGPDLVITEGSYFENSLDEAFKKDDVISEVFDSHLACAAKSRDEAARTLEVPEDGGLFADVVRKKKMIETLNAHVKEGADGKYKDKRLISIQTSFNPDTGYMYMGLERDEAMEVADSVARSAKTNKHPKPEFNTRVLEKLVNSGQVIYTKNLVEDPRVSEIFDKYFVAGLDWEKNYVASMEGFWKSMDAMVEEGVLDIFNDKVKSIYPDLTAEEIEARSMILLSNAFNAYTTIKVFGEWPHRFHKEPSFVFTENENGPYSKNSSFGIFIKSKRKLPSGITTAETIVRNNRKAGRITSPDNTYDDLQDYIEAPVPGILKVAIKGSNADWEAIRKIDWSTIPANWSTMTSEEFEHSWEELKHINHGAVLEILKLREKMAILLDPKSVSSPSITSGRVVVLPVLVDKYTRIQSIASGLVYKGYSKKIIKT